MARFIDIDVKWYDLGLTAKLLATEITVKKAMFIAAQKTQADAVAYMKSNAPWTDQTGNARNGLNGVVEADNEGVSIVLFHSVPYGVFLETRWSGRYSIIMPTVKIYGKKYMSLVKSVMFA